MLLSTRHYKWAALKGNVICSAIWEFPVMIFQWKIHISTNQSIHGKIVPEIFIFSLRKQFQAWRKSKRNTSRCSATTTGKDSCKSKNDAYILCLLVSRASLSLWGGEIHIDEEISGPRLPKKGPLILQHMTVLFIFLVWFPVSACTFLSLLNSPSLKRVSVIPAGEKVHT